MDPGGPWEERNCRVWFGWVGVGWFGVEHYMRVVFCWVNDKGSKIFEPGEEGTALARVVMSSFLSQFLWMASTTNS